LRKAGAGAGAGGRKAKKKAKAKKTFRSGRGGGGGEMGFYSGIPHSRSINSIHPGILASEYPEVLTKNEYVKWFMEVLIFRAGTSDLYT
jgi:hypothetical protein